MKTLVLYRHSEKTPDGKHISLDKGMPLAMATGAVHTRPVNHLFYGPLIRTSETACYLAAGNPAAFSGATLHPTAVVGLGDNDLFADMFTNEVKAQMKTNGWSLLETVLKGHSANTAAFFGQMAINAIGYMFDQMDDGQLGVGVFHDPTIALAAHFLGFKSTRSLSSMEGIQFSLSDDGTTCIVDCIRDAGIVS